MGAAQGRTKPLWILLLNKLSEAVIKRKPLEYFSQMWSVYYVLLLSDNILQCTSC